MHSLSSVCLLLKGQQGGLDRSDQVTWLARRRLRADEPKAGAPLDFG